MILYDPRGHDWDSWCKLVVELFAPQAVPYMPEENWRDFAASMIATSGFMRSGVPDGRNFDSWQDWAQQMVGILTLEN